MQDKETDKTKLAVIANTLNFMQADLNSIKNDMREVKNAYVPLSAFNEFKIEYAKYLVAADAKFSTKEEIDGIRKIGWLVVSASVIALVAAFFKLIIIN